MRSVRLFEPAHAPLEALRRSIVTLCVALTVAVTAGPARAANDNPSREAAKHFQRGVDLYTDGDFRGALVEFKKAYQVWPRANVLYDIGQTEYQLLDYAAALKSMERYLADTGPNAQHRAEVEATVEVLRGRVGRVVLSADVSGCEVTIDDQPVGNTPLDGPLLVSVGPRRLAVHCSGDRTATRRVEVIAGESVRIELKLPPAPANALQSAQAQPDTPAQPSIPGRGWNTAWIVSGVLVAATIALGTSALVEDGKLASLRNTFPASMNDINRQAKLTEGLAITSDILGIASIAAVGVATYLTIRYERNKHVTLGMTPRSVQVGGTF